MSIYYHKISWKDLHNANLISMFEKQTKEPVGLGVGTTILRNFVALVCQHKFS